MIRTINFDGWPGRIIDRPSGMMAHVVMLGTFSPCSLQVTLLSSIGMSITFPMF